MIKKLLTIFVTLAIPTVLLAQSIPTISPWLTDSSGNVTQRTINAILKITGLSNGCLNITSGLVGSQVCGGGSSFAWPFTAHTGYVSTSTTVGFFNGLFSIASSTFSSNLFITSLSQGGLYTGTNGLVGTFSTTTASCSGNASCSPFIVIGSSPITISASGSGGSGTGNVSTSTHETQGGLAYWTSNSATPALLGEVSTSTLSASSPLTGSFTQVGSGGSLGIQAASNSQNGYLSSFDYQLIHAATTTFSSPLSYSLGTNAVNCPTCNTSSASVTSVGSASGITGGTITTSGTLSLTNWIATSSGETSGQIPYWTTTNGWPAKLNSVGTSSIASGVGITVTNGSTAFVLGTQPSVACNTANATTFGCLATTDFNNFNNKVATSASEISSQVAYFTTTNGTPAKIQGVATSTIGADGTSLSNSGTTGFQIGGGNNTISLNLGHTNTWTVLQNFNYSSSTIYSSFLTSSSTFAQIGKLTLSTTTTGCLNTSSTGVVYAGSCGAGGSPAGITNNIQFNNNGSFGGSNDFSWDNTNDILSIATSSGNTSRIESGGFLDIHPIPASGTNSGGGFDFYGGEGGSISGTGGTAEIEGGDAIAGTSNGGDVLLVAGGANGGGTVGHVGIETAPNDWTAYFDSGNLSSNKTFTFPNETGTFALGTGSTGNCANWTDTNTLGTTGSPCGSGGGSDPFTHPFTSLYSATTSVISIGTSTPSYAQLTLATSTVPQLSLGDGSTSHNQWTFNNNAGTLNLATASPTTYAVNSTPSISISDSGFGTTTLNVPLKVKTDASMYRAIEVSSAGGQGIFVTTTGDSHALGADYNNTNGNGSAINATSNNANTSAVQISGAETGVATLKLTHTGVAGANASLVNFSSNNAGYLGQGLFMSVLAAADTQKILNLRGNNAERMTFLVGGQLGLGVTNPGFQLQISTTTASNTFKPQLGLTDSASASGLKNWTLSSEGGNLYIATATDAFATSSITAFALDKNGFLTLKADAGVGCGQFDANGKLTNTGSACDTNTGTVTSVVAGAGFQNQGLTITTSGTLITSFASSSNPTLSNVPYVTGVGDVSNPIKFGFLATTTLAGGGPITVSNSPVLFGASGAVLGCTNASSGVTGCLTGTDWNTFNGKLGSYDPFTHPFTSLYSATSSVMMFGTTTPDYAQLTLSTSTQPQLALTDGTNAAQWSVRSVGSNLYFATTSPTTFATTSPAAFSIVGTGYPIFGVGTTSPFAVASIVNLNPSAVPLFSVSSSTATGSGMPVFEIDSVGHYQSSGPKPTVSSCGSSPSVVGNDNAMVLTTGSTGITECTVTFANTWSPNTPICSFDDQSNSSITITGSTTATTLKIGLSASLTSANIGVLCEGYQ